MGDWYDPGACSAIPVPKPAPSLTRLRAWFGGSEVASPEWERIATLMLDRGIVGCQLELPPGTRWQRVKLRSPAKDVEVRRWTLLLHDGSIQDLSVGCLLQGTETRPILIAGRTVLAMTLDCQTRECARAVRVEVWAERERVVAEPV